MMGCDTCSRQTIRPCSRCFKFFDSLPLDRTPSGFAGARLHCAGLGGPAVLAGEFRPLSNDFRLKIMEGA